MSLFFTRMMPGSCHYPAKKDESMLQTIRNRLSMIPAKPHRLLDGTGEKAALTVRKAVRRYGETTARGEASTSTCAAMVRAWLRQRRIIPGKRPLTGGANGHRQPFRLQPSSAAWCPPFRRSKRRIDRFRASAKARSVRCSSFKSQSLCWVVI